MVWMQVKPEEFTETYSFSALAVLRRAEALAGMHTVLFGSLTWKWRVSVISSIYST